MPIFPAASACSSSGSGEKSTIEYEDDHPFIVRDPNKCILCGLCAAVLGSIIYRLLIALAYQTNIFPSAAFRLISAVIVTIALAIPAIKQLLDMQRKRKENLRDAHID